MKTSKLVWLETCVGVFAVACIAALLMLTVVLSHDAFLSRSKPLELVFQDVMGLRVGDPVNSRGVVIGKVTDMHLEDDGVHVIAELNGSVPLHTDAQARVLSSSVLGGRYLSVDSGTTDAPLAPPEHVLQGSPTPDLMESASKVVEDIRVALNDGIIDDVSASLANIRTVTEALAQNKGTLGRLINEDGLYEDLQGTLANLKAVTEGQGTIGKLLTDDTLYNDAQVVVAQVREISTRLANGEGSLGKLLSSDSAAYDDLAKTLENARTISDDLAAGKGSLGKLLADDSLYNEVDSILHEGRAAIDDIRETSPITTFSSIFFGIF